MLMPALPRIPIARLFECTIKGACHAFKVKWIEIDCEIAGNLRNRRTVGSRYRNTASKCLEHWQSKSFIERREEHATRFLIKLNHACAVDEAGKLQDMSNAQGLCLRDYRPPRVFSNITHDRKDTR